MSNFKDLVKGGWHPGGKDGGTGGGKKESWRKDFKGVNQVVSLRPNTGLSASNRARLGCLAKAEMDGRTHPTT